MEPFFVLCNFIYSYFYYKYMKVIQNILYLWQILLYEHLMNLFNGFKLVLPWNGQYCTWSVCSNVAIIGGKKGWRFHRCYSLSSFLAFHEGYSHLNWDVNRTFCSRVANGCSKGFTSVSDYKECFSSIYSIL